MLRYLYGKIQNQRIRKKLSWDKQKVVLIASTGRTGTEYLADFFNRNNKTLNAYHEPRPDLFDLSVDFIRYGHSIDSCTNKMMKLRHKYLLNNVQEHKNIYVESNPNLAYLLPVVNKVFPNLKVVHVVRNPYDYMRSAFSKHLKNNNSILFMGENDHRKRICPSDYENEIFNLEQNRFNLISWHWKKSNEEIRKNLNKYKILHKVFKFEEIFSSDQKVKEDNLKSLLDFAFGYDGLSVDTGVQLNKTEGKYNIGSRDSWKPNQIDDFRRIVAEEAKHYNYKIL